MAANLESSCKFEQASGQHITNCANSRNINPMDFTQEKEKVPHMENQLQRIIASPLPPLVPCHRSSAGAKTIDNIIRNY